MNAWIDAEQQWPPIGERVLMVISYVDRVRIGFIDEDGLCHSDDRGTAEVKYLRYWQPLPEPPGRTETP